MAINRFDRPGQYDFSMQHYVPQEFIPNFEAWDQVLGQFQKEKDITSALAEKVPNAITPDKNVRDEYISTNRQAIDNLVEMYSEGNINLARAKQSELMRQLSRDFAPGGKAANLERRYKEYSTALSDIKKRYKDDPSFMMQYAQNVLDSGIKPGDLEQSIGSPNIGAYVNIGKELDTALQGFKSNKGTVIKGLNGNWIWKETNEILTEKEVNSAARKILSQPRFRDQLRIETWDANRRIDDEVAKNQYISSVDNNTKEAIDKINSLDTKTFQQMAIAQGLDVGASKPDGIEGPKTRAARKQVIREIETNSIKLKDNYKKDLFLLDQIRNQYISPISEKLSFKKQSLDVKANPFALKALDQKNKKDLITLMQKVPRHSSAIPFTGRAIKVDPIDIDKRTSEAFKSRGTAIQALNEHMSNAGITIPYDDVGSVLKAYNDSKINGKFDSNEFTKRYGNVSNELLNYLSDDGNVQALTAHNNTIAEIDEQISMNEHIDNSISKDFMESTEGIKVINSIYEDYKHDRGFKRMLESNNITNKKEFREYVENVRKNEDVRKVNAFTWLSTAPPSIKERVVNDFRSARDKHYKNNAHTYKSLSPIAVSGEDKTVVGNFQKHLGKVFEDSGGLAFIGAYGSPLEFVNDSGTLKYDRNQVKKVKVTPQIIDNKVVFGLSGEAGSGDNLQKVYATAEIDSENADGSIGVKGAEIVADTYDSQGKLILDSASKAQRQIGSMIYFNSAYDFPFKEASRIIPNENSSKDINNYGILPNGNIVKGNQVRLTDVTPVSSVKVNETGTKINIYTRNVGGQQVWNVTQTDGNGGEVIVYNESNTRPTFTSLADAVSTVALMTTDIHNQVNGVYERVSKSQAKVIDQNAAAIIFE